MFWAYLIHLVSNGFRFERAFQLDLVGQQAQAQATPRYFITASVRSVARLRRPDKVRRRDLPLLRSATPARRRRSRTVHRPWRHRTSPSSPSPKPYRHHLHRSSPTATGPPSPPLQLRRRPRLTARGPPRPRVGTASSAGSWPPRPPRVFSLPTTPTGAADARRSAGP
jgi:hypothetical protein